MEDIFEKAHQWAHDPYFDLEDRKEILNLFEKNETKELTERFYKDLEFGTGGLRAIMGMGTNRINRYTIRRATYAVALTLQKEFEKKEIGVAISYDSRINSFNYAKETASVFAACGIKSTLYKHLNPVPLLSFMVRQIKAQAGIMITASHNPPIYNGYKVYWDDGAQIIPPVDKNIIATYKTIDRFSKIPFMNFEEGQSLDLIVWAPDEIENNYYDLIAKKVIDPELCKNKGKNLKIVYTPIHGTGKVPCSTLLQKIGFSDFHLVKEQAEPDGNFPTVKSPNPEDKEAMEMGTNLMKELNADITFGTDPDTDRLGVAILKNNEVFFPNGNQIGLLMLYYICHQLKEKGTLPKNPYFVKTIVTSPLHEVVAKSFNIEVINTLTGFKWICSKMREYDQTKPDSHFIFATEESFGYLHHNLVRDKDGISSMALMAEVALWYKERSMDIVDALDEIYEKYGFAHESLLSLNFEGKDGKEKIERIMEAFRKLSTEKGIICDESIDKIEDYKKKIVTSIKTKLESPLKFPKSNVLGLHFDSGNRLYLRPSGTEPKIKFYIMITKNEGSLDNKKQKAHKKTKEFLDFIRDFSNRA